MRHFDELELLDAYYVPEHAHEQLAHLETCALCTTRFARLTRSLREGVRRFDAQIERKPESFWLRQRLSILRSISSPSAEHSAARRFLVAASLVAVLSGGVAYNAFRTAPQPVTPPAGAHAVERDAPAVEGEAPHSDPWASDELTEFHDVVEWETWNAQKGGGS